MVQGSQSSAILSKAKNREARSTRQILRFAQDDDFNSPHILRSHRIVNRRHRRHSFRCLVIAMIHQHRRANFLLAALLADEVDQIGSAQLDLVFAAKIVKLLEMDACHGSSLRR